MLQSVNTFTVRPNVADFPQAIGVATLPIRLGCKLTPELKLKSMVATGVKTFSWSMKMAPLPDGPVPTRWNQSTPVDFAVNYLRDFTLSNFSVAGLVTLSNPYSKTLKVTKAAAGAVGGSSAASLVPGSIKCDSSEGGVTTLAPNASVECALAVNLGSNSLSNLVVSFNTIEGKRRLERRRGEHRGLEKRREVWGGGKGEGNWRKGRQEWEGKTEEGKERAGGKKGKRGGKKRGGAV